MHWNVMWAPWEKPGLEHLHLTQNRDGFFAESLVIGVNEDKPFRIHYEVRCDLRWTLQEATIRVFDGETLTLQSDGAGHWLSSANVPLIALDGCIDVDITATPFSNTLPIKRLALPLGDSMNINVAHISIPSLEIKPGMRQYTCLTDTEQGGMYRYRSLASGFTVDFSTDAVGLVIDFPQAFSRVWSS